MCGIIGEVARDPLNVRTFQQMRDELSHRGPDGEGLYLNDSETVALGHRRLSIIDLSSAGDQPMPNEDESIWLVFNGEIYNYKDLRSQLEDAGHDFRSETDSEVIVHGYEEWGTNCVERLRGMFAFGIWDESRDRLFLARDRLGIKPLYYFQCDGRFIFASELKGILSDKSIDRNIDPVGLRHYLRYRYISAPYTIWENIRKLKPGCTLVFENGESTIEQYWNPYDYVDDGGNEEVALREIERRLEDAVESHLTSDVPIGVLLSGGLDSSIVSALASRVSNGLSAFSLGFDTDSDDELSHAAKVAETFDLNHHTENLSATGLDELLDEILYYYDEPLSDSSVFPTYLLMQEVSDNVKVALSGDGGDEIFAGYTWYETYLQYQRLRPMDQILGIIGQTTFDLGKRLDSSLLNAVSRRFLPFSRSRIDRYQQIMHPPFDDDELDGLLTDEYVVANPDDVPARHCNGELDVKDMQLLDMNTFMVDDILTKVDRASMAHSLEVRVPLLDHKLAQYMLSLDSNLVYKNGEKKHLLKKIGRNVLPSSIIDREKSGFGAPLSELGFVDRYKHILHDSEAARDGVFDSEELSNVADSGIAYHKLVRLILFELWYRRWKPSNAKEASHD